MPEYIPFARNYVDRSTSYAYQFEFFCWRCGSGYLSDQEIVSATGAAAGGLAAKKAASFLPFIGDFVGDRAADALGDRAKDAALHRATERMVGLFAQCPQCGQWRCRARCWNSAAGRCLSCAPALTPPPPQPWASPPASPSPYPHPLNYGVASGPYQPGAAAPMMPAPAQAGYPPPAYASPPGSPPLAPGVIQSQIQAGSHPFPPASYPVGATFAPLVPPAPLPPGLPTPPPAGRTIFWTGLMFGIVPALIGVVAGLAIPIHVDTFQCAVCTDPAQPVLVAAAVAVILLDPLLYALAGWRAARRLGRTGAGVQSALLASVVAGVVSGISIVLGIHTLELRLNPAIASFATTSAAISAAVGLVATLGISAFFGWIGALIGASRYQQAIARAQQQAIYQALQSQGAIR